MPWSNHLLWLRCCLACAAERESADKVPTAVVQPVKKKRRKSGLLKKVEAELAAERAAAAAKTASPAAQRPIRAGKQPAERAPKAARVSAAGSSRAGPNSEPTAMSAAAPAAIAAEADQDERPRANGAAAAVTDEVPLKRKKKQKKGAEDVQDTDGSRNGAAFAEAPDVQRDADRTRAGRPSNGSVAASHRPKKGEGKGGGAAAAQAALKRKISKMKAHQRAKQ